MCFGGITWNDPPLLFYGTVGATLGYSKSDIFLKKSKKVSKENTLSL